MKRVLRIVIPLALIPLLGGCVYLRLNKLRMQMSDFQKYVTFIDDPGPGLMLKEPVLLTSDLEWITGFKPSKVEGDKERSILTYTLKKRKNPKSKETDKDLTSEALFMFANEKLARVQLPPEYNAILNGRVVAQLMRQADDADINKSGKTAAWAVEDSSVLPGMTQVRRACGEPSKLEAKDGQIILTYHYDLVGTNTDGPEVVAIFAYDLGDQSFRRGEGRVGRVNMTNQSDGSGHYRMKLWRK